MRKFIIWFVLVFLSFQVDLFSQVDYPKSYASIGVGIGANYAEGIGIKSVIGYKDNGLLIGVGSMIGSTFIGYEIGGQVSYKWWFLNLTYGATGVVSNLYVNKGGTFITGVMWNLEKKKRLFLEIGLGFILDTQIKSSSIYFEPNIPTFNLGLSYRFGGKESNN